MFDILKFIKQVEVNFMISSNSALEEKLEESVKNFTAFSPIPSELIKTLTYMRLRRNHFTHLNTSLSNKMQLIITNEGSALNYFWGKSINSLDFTNHSIENYSIEETIELLKLLRLIVEKVDEHLSNNLDTDKIISFINSEYFHGKINILNKHIRVRKIKSILNAKFGASESESYIQNLI